MLCPNPEFVQFQNWMAIPSWNLHVGLLYSLAVEICRLYQSLGLPNWHNIYLYNMLLPKQELVQLENWMD
jgi:hypothetical protein